MIRVVPVKKRFWWPHPYAGNLLWRKITVGYRYFVGDTDVTTYARPMEGLMYSQIQFPPGVRNVRIKPTYRASLDCWRNGQWLADHCGDTWFVWHAETRKVLALFHMAPNINGWSAPQAHARSYLLQAIPFNPFELDSVP